MGVVVRRYIDFHILLIPTPLVFVPFNSNSNRVSYRIFCWGGGRSNCKGSASVRKHGHTCVSVRAT